MKKEKHLAIIVIASIMLAIVLFILPRKVLKGSQEVTQASEASTEESKHSAAAVPLNIEVRARIDSLKSLNGNTLELATLREISDVFAAESRFDSSAYYMAQAAQRSQNLELYARTGDLYFQAYNMSLDPVQREKYAEETRLFYDKILSVSPRDLHARTNKAMTFVSSSAPMQAITLLRQVLADEPKYVPAIMSLGALSMQSGQYEKAVLRFKEVLTVDPNNMRGKLGLAYSLLETDDKEKGRSILMNLLKDPSLDEVLQSEIENTLKNIE